MKITKRHILDSEKAIKLFKLDDYFLNKSTENSISIVNYKTGKDLYFVRDITKDNYTLKVVSEEKIEGIAENLINEYEIQNAQDFVIYILKTLKPFNIRKNIEYLPKNDVSLFEEVYLKDNSSLTSDQLKLPKRIQKELIEEKHNNLKKGIIVAICINMKAPFAVSDNYDYCVICDDNSQVTVNRNEFLNLKELEREKKNAKK